MRRRAGATKERAMASVIIALVAGVLTGAFVVWMVMRGQGHANPAVMQSQGEIKARLDETLVQVQHLGVIFANAGQRGRAGELVLENLLEATGMDQHRDFEVQVVVDGSRPDVVLTLAGRGKLVIDAKFPLDEFQRATAAESPQERRRALGAHARAVAGHVSALARRDYPLRSKTPSISRCASYRRMTFSRRHAKSVPSCSTTRCGSES